MKKVPQNYCPTCGKQLESRPSQSGGPERRHCAACQISIYDSPSVVVATLPVLKDQVVLVRRATQPGLGLWSYPGGYLEAGETLEEGAIRETQEETGLDVQINGLLGVYSRPGGQSVTVMFEASCDGQKWQPGPEVTEIAAFAPSEIPWSELAFWTTTYALEDWVRARQDGLTLPRAWRVGPPRASRR